MVLVTGCTGFPGKVLSGMLIERGYRVRGFDLWKSGNVDELTEFIDGSILDYELMLNTCEGVETIYHLLDVEYPSHYGRGFMKRTNVKGTEILLKAARDQEVKKIVFLSSAKVYGKPRIVPVEEDDRCKPNTPFGKDKLKAEALCRKYTEDHGMDITILRPTAITGPGVDDAMILVILYMALGMGDSNRMYIAGEGESRFQLVHPYDVAEACILAAQSDRSAGKTYNLGSDEVPPQSEQVHRIREKAGLDCEIKHISSLATRVLSFLLKPLGINYLRKEHVIFILSNFLLECRVAKEDLGWKPTRNNVDIVVETIDWYRKEKL